MALMKWRKEQLQYAQDAMVHEEPWRLWECRLRYSTASFRREWHTPAGPFFFHEDWEFRRKPETIKIGDYDVPMPYFGEMERGQGYFVPIPADPECPAGYIWADSEFDRKVRTAGQRHLTYDAAITHGKAMRSLTAMEGVE